MYVLLHPQKKHFTDPSPAPAQGSFTVKGGGGVDCGSPAPISMAQDAVAERMQNAAKLPSAGLHLDASQLESVLVKQCFATLRVATSDVLGFCFGGMRIALGSVIDV